MRAVPSFVDPESTLRAAAQVMVAQGNDVVVLLGPEGPSSVVTGRDIVRALAQQADPDTVWVADVASTDLIAVEPSASILDVIRHMAGEHLRQLPVNEKGQVVGLVVSEDIIGLLDAQTSSAPRA